MRHLVDCPGDRDPDVCEGWGWAAEGRERPAHSLGLTCLTQELQVLLPRWPGFNLHKFSIRVFPVNHLLVLRANPVFSVIHKYIPMSAKKRHQKSRSSEGRKTESVSVIWGAPGWCSPTPAGTGSPRGVGLCNTSENRSSSQHLRAAHVLIKTTQHGPMAALGNLHGHPLQGSQLG